MATAWQQSPAYSASNTTNTVQNSLVQNGTVVGDGSWLLDITVTDLKKTCQLRVRGDLHIGGLMLRLVEHLDVTRDWSDHALWWPKMRKWLTHTRSTLDQVGVTADSELEFTPMHKVARVQLPDLQMIDARLDYSCPVFSACCALCKDLGVRYPEELSFKRYIDPDRLRKQQGIGEDEVRGGVVVPLPGTMKKQTPISASMAALNVSGGPQQQQHGYGTLGSRAVTPYDGATDMPGTGTFQRGASVAPSLASYRPNSPTRLGSVPKDLQEGNTIRSPVTPSYSWGDTLCSQQYDQALVHSPSVSTRVAYQAGLFRPKNYDEKAAINRGWLDSSRSLMEQGVFEGEVILLRFKFTQNFDLNAKYDPVRINQLFEQCKWQVLMEELDCTDEESMLFAALQLQVSLQAGQPDPAVEEEENDVELLLDELENQLDVAASQRRQDITSVPELTEYLRYFKPKRLTLKGWKRGFFVFRDLYLSYYHSAQEAQGPPLGRIYLKGCEISPDVNLQQNKYCIKLLIPSAEGMHDFVLKCDSEHQYVRWMAGCRLAARGKTMADSEFNSEVECLKRLLCMQNPSAQQQQLSPRRTVEPSQTPMNFDVEEFVPGRVAKRRTRQQIQQRVGEAHSNVRTMSCTDAKLAYIRALSALPEHGIHYFIVRFRGAKKDDLMGIAFNRMMRMNRENGESLKTWRYASMKKWHVNWEIKHAALEDENVEFKPLSSDCKVAHEFIGGYIFCSLRTKEQNPTLNEELFHRLTGGHHAHGGGMVNI